MKTTPRPAIEALDVPLADVQTDIKRLMALEFDRIQQAHDVADGRLAEQRHYLDADPDTAVPLPGIPHPKEAS